MVTLQITTRQLDAIRQLVSVALLDSRCSNNRRDADREEMFLSCLKAIDLAVRPIPITGS